MTVTIWVPIGSLAAVERACSPHWDGGTHRVGWQKREPSPGCDIMHEGGGAKGHEYVAVQLTRGELDLFLAREHRPQPCPHLADGGCPFRNLHCKYPACTEPGYTAR